MPRDTDFYEYGDVLFDTSVLGRFDDVPASRAVGLIIFEASLPSDDVETQRQNVADAQDRLNALNRIAGEQTNRYRPALLIVTWQEQSMADLGIIDYLSAFEQTSILSLESMGDLDARLERCITDLVPAVHRKKQVVLPLRLLLDRIIPGWNAYLATVKSALTKRPEDLQLALQALESGIAILNEVSHSAKSAIGHVKISDTATFSPVVLPAFQPTSSSSTSDTVDSLTGYLSNEDFSGLDDLALLVGPLKRSVTLKQGQFCLHFLPSSPENDVNAALPIAEILASISFLVFGELEFQDMPLESYWDPSKVEEIKQGYFTTTSAQFDKLVSKKIKDLTRSLEHEQNESTGFMTPTSKKSMKRGRMSSTEHLSPSPKELKMAKNARLLQVMKDVDRTLGEMSVDTVF